MLWLSIRVFEGTATRPLRRTCVRINDTRSRAAQLSARTNADILENRVLKAAAPRLLRLPGVQGRLTVEAEPPGVYLGVGRTVPMAPDLVFRRPGGDLAFAGDAKYKLTSDGRGRNGDYYQLFAYLTALDIREGVLVYCQAEGEPERKVVVRNAGTVLRTYPLSLDGSADELTADELRVRRCPTGRSCGAGPGPFLSHPPRRVVASRVPLARPSHSL